MKNNLSTLLLIAIMVATTIFSACGEKKSEFNVSDEDISPNAVGIHNETIQKMILNISSPIEIASLLIEEDVPFSSSYLYNTDKVGEIVSSKESALNLGILGADLGYLNMYDKTGSVMTHLSSIQTLADNLNIDQFFDFNTISRLAEESNNLDSLIYLSTSSFNEMDEYLRNQNRSNQSSLIITGVWIESTYLISQVYGSYPNNKIAERIGEQKIILNDLMLILDNYKDDSHFAKLLNELKPLKEIYDGVTITEVKLEPKKVIENGMLKVVQNSKSTVDITDDQIRKITETIAGIRDNIQQA